MTAHRTFHEKERLPTIEKIYLILLHIIEAKTGEILNNRNDLEKALKNVGTEKLGSEKELEKLIRIIEKALDNKIHDMQLKVIVGIWQDELSRIFIRNNKPTKGIARPGEIEIHALLRGTITSHEEISKMALAAMNVLEGII